MEFSTSFDFVGPILQICLVDLLLSCDNAILIAMACAALPVEARRKAIVLGTGAAVLFRVILTLVATLVLRAPYLKLIGAVLLLLIAIELLAGDPAGRRSALKGDTSAGIWRAVILIVVADAVMSLDNVVAVAAAAQDNLLYLFLGLLISIPILVFSSLFITRILETHPVVVTAGAALLGWIAGKTAVADPAIAASLQTQSFGLVALAPLLGAAYVVLQGRILREAREAAHGAGTAAPAPAASSAPVRVPAPAPAPAASAAQGPDPFLKRFSAMDLTIMAGVAVPLIGLVFMVVYLIGKAVTSH